MTQQSLDHQNPAAVRLCAIFAEVLGVPAIGLDDDFFELGGQSLHAMLIAGRVKTEFGVAISLMDLFDHPTVGRLLDRMGEGS
jgi:acyl carrier protein